jgi:hypothetical protein
MWGQHSASAMASSARSEHSMGVNTVIPTDLAGAVALRGPLAIKGIVTRVNDVKPRLVALT